MRIAARYGRWPHEVAELPFHYFLALRGEYLSSLLIEAGIGVDVKANDEVIDSWHNESVTGELA